MVYRCRSRLPLRANISLIRLVLVCLLTQVAGEAGPSRFSATSSWAKPLTKSIPALRIKRQEPEKRSSPTVVSASFKAMGKAAGSFIANAGSGSALSQCGFYYGLREELLKRNPGARVRTANSLDNAMEELRGIREELSALQRQVIALRRKLGEEDIEEDTDSTLLARRKRQREYDQIAAEVEKWAEDLLIGKGKDDGWKEVGGWNMYNKDTRTRCYVKWMKDSRGKNADKSDDNLYPCLKLYSTLDASLEDVCAYLADEKRLPEYNDLVVKHRDLEEIAPHSKICWGQTPQIMFIKPRDFVTFCHHRWRRDGTEVIINQACEHKDAPGVKEEGQGKACRAYALRGANFISRHPDDPNKTQFALVTHANPGGDLPHWLCEKAVNWLSPVEPFKLLHKINHKVMRAAPYLERTKMVNATPGRSGKPGGLSQMGYACFWPNGGGLQEGNDETISYENKSLANDTEESTEEEPTK